jgi:hypothetical protein
VSRRRRKAGCRRPPAPADQSPSVPGWMDVYGEQMFVVDFTPAGFPIGIRQENDPHTYGEE